MVVVLSKTEDHIHRKFNFEPEDYRHSVLLGSKMSFLNLSKLIQLDVLNQTEYSNLLQSYMKTLNKVSTRDFKDFGKK